MEAAAGVEPAHKSFADSRVNHFATRPNTGDNVAKLAEENNYSVFTSIIGISVK